MQSMEKKEIAIRAISTIVLTIFMCFFIWGNQDRFHERIDHFVTDFSKSAEAAHMPKEQIAAIQALFQKSIDNIDLYFHSVSVMFVIVIGIAFYNIDFQRHFQRRQVKE